MVGADVESLERLADEMSRAARRLDDVRDRLTTSVRSAAWVGAEAEAFRRSWNSYHSHVLFHAGACLHAAETELRRQAVEQTDASAADAVTGSAAMAGLIAALAAATGEGSHSHSHYPDTWAGFLATQPTPTPQEVARRWAAMTEDEQAEVKRTHGDRIRNLDGIPFETRDELNQAALKDDMSRLDPASEEWQNRNRILTALGGSVPPVRQLAVYDASDSSFPPLAAVSVGNLDTAANVAVKTPGLDSTSDDIVGGTDEMALLRRETMFQTGADSKAVACVQWFGYRTPQMSDVPPTVSNPALAEAGAVKLTSFVEGIDAVHDVSANHTDVNLVLLGHSYGSLTSAIAIDHLNDHRSNAVDDAVLYGSPGVGWDPGPVRLPNGNEAYIMRADLDPVTKIASYVPALGLDPALAASPDHILSTQAERAALPDGGTYESRKSLGHSQYLMENSTALYNVAQIVGGNPEGAIVDPLGKLPIRPTEVGEAAMAAGGAAVNYVEQKTQEAVDLAQRAGESALNAAEAAAQAAQDAADKAWKAMPWN